MGLGLEDMQGSQEVQGPQRGPYRLRMAPTRDVDGRNSVLGFDHQALELDTETGQER